MSLYELEQINLESVAVPEFIARQRAMRAALLSGSPKGLDAFLARAKQGELVDRQQAMMRAAGGEIVSTENDLISEIATSDAPVDERVAGIQEIQSAGVPSEMPNRTPFILKMTSVPSASDSSIVKSTTSNNSAEVFASEAAKARFFQEELERLSAQEGKAQQLGADAKSAWVVATDVVGQAFVPLLQTGQITSVLNNYAVMNNIPHNPLNPGQTLVDVQNYIKSLPDADSIRREAKSLRDLVADSIIGSDDNEYRVWDLLGTLTLGLENTEEVDIPVPFTDASFSIKKKNIINAVAALDVLPVLGSALFRALKGAAIAPRAVPGSVADDLAKTQPEVLGDALRKAETTGTSPREMGLPGPAAEYQYKIPKTPNESVAVGPDLSSYKQYEADIPDYFYDKPSAADRVRRTLSGVVGVPQPSKFTVTPVKEGVQVQARLGASVNVGFDSLGAAFRRAKLYSDANDGATFRLLARDGDTYEYVDPATYNELSYGQQLALRGDYLIEFDTVVPYRASDFAINDQLKGKVRAAALGPTSQFDRRINGLLNYSVVKDAIFGRKVKETLEPFTSLPRASQRRIEQVYNNSASDANRKVYSTAELESMGLTQGEINGYKAVASTNDMAYYAENAKAAYTLKNNGYVSVRYDNNNFFAQVADDIPVDIGEVLDVTGKQAVSRYSAVKQLENKVGQVYKFAKPVDIDGVRYDYGLVRSPKDVGPIPTTVIPYVNGYTRRNYYGSFVVEGVRKGRWNGRDADVPFTKAIASSQDEAARYADELNSRGNSDGVVFRIRPVREATEEGTEIGALYNLGVLKSSNRADQAIDQLGFEVDPTSLADTLHLSFANSEKLNMAKVVSGLSTNYNDYYASRLGISKFIPGSRFTPPKERPLNYPGTQEQFNKELADAEQWHSHINRIAGTTPEMFEEAVRRINMFIGSVLTGLANQTAKRLPARVIKTTSASLRKIGVNIRNADSADWFVGPFNRGATLFQLGGQMFYRWAPELISTYLVGLSKNRGMRYFFSGNYHADFVQVMAGVTGKSFNVSKSNFSRGAQVWKDVERSGVLESVDAAVMLADTSINFWANVTAVGRAPGAFGKAAEAASRAPATVADIMRFGGIEVPSSINKINAYLFARNQYMKANGIKQLTEADDPKVIALMEEYNLSETRAGQIGGYTGLAALLTKYSSWPIKYAQAMLGLDNSFSKLETVKLWMLMVGGFGAGAFYKNADMLTDQVNEIWANNTGTPLSDDTRRVLTGGLVEYLLWRSHAFTLSDQPFDAGDMAISYRASPVSSLVGGTADLIKAGITMDWGRVKQTGANILTDFPATGFADSTFNLAKDMWFIASDESKDVLGEGRYAVALGRMVPFIGKTLKLYAAAGADRIVVNGKMDEIGQAELGHVVAQLTGFSTYDALSAQRIQEELYGPYQEPSTAGGMLGKAEAAADEYYQMIDRTLSVDAKQSMDVDRIEALLAIKQMTLEGMSELEKERFLERVRTKLMRGMEDKSLYSKALRYVELMQEGRVHPTSNMREWLKRVLPESDMKDRTIDMINDALEQEELDG